MKRRIALLFAFIMVFAMPITALGFEARAVNGGSATMVQGRTRSVQDNSNRQRDSMRAIAQANTTPAAVTTPAAMDPDAVDTARRIIEGAGLYWVTIPDYNDPNNVSGLTGPLVNNELLAVGSTAGTSGP